MNQLYINITINKSRVLEGFSMNEYQLVEFSSKKETKKIVSDKSKLYEVLFDLYQNKLEVMFDKNGKSKGFVSIFVNSHQLFSIRDITLKNNDEIQIVTSISGG